ncbi:hypothetical protein ACEF06_19130 [Brevibacillus agri]|uniref:hypothetical protein n=1 Tax=Brevibacillus agri TaxID=51101 RepID=UPI0002A519A5|nr:hypothetical protein D478_16299 [Brevibacillus agri BAB-2500]
MTFIYRQFARVFVGGLAAMALLAGCAADTSNQQKEAASASSDSPAAAITLLTPKAPSLIPAVYMENTAAAGTFKVATWDSLEQLLAGIQSDEAPRRRFLRRLSAGRPRRDLRRVSRCRRERWTRQ